MARETSISKEKCRGCFAKAMEFYRQAEAALESGAFSVCASNSIHSAMLFLDSLSIADLGLKSSSGSHYDAIPFFKRVAIGSRPQEKEGIAKTFLSMVQQKSVVEYSDEKIGRADAELMLHKAGKIMKFAEAELSFRKYL